ncbi:hypothetical protein OAH05_03000, partial [bacterium]|nr:hypothetical protein [bacterium]
TPAFSSAAGHIGINCRFDHDISLLIPEIWCRMSTEERDPQALIDNRLMEQVADIELEDGRVIPARRLGYRITKRFARKYFGRIFDIPETVFSEEILRPETQDQQAFIEGIEQIMEAYQRVATQYFEDGSIEDACPPLKALLHIMAHGNFEGKDERDSSIRDLFTRESLLKSDWYQERLKTQQKRDIHMWQKHLNSVDHYLNTQDDLDCNLVDTLQERRKLASKNLETVSSTNYVQSLIGTIGAAPMSNQQ